MRWKTRHKALAAISILLVAIHALEVAGQPQGAKQVAAAAEPRPAPGAGQVAAKASGYGYGRREHSRGYEDEDDEDGYYHNPGWRERHGHDDPYKCPGAGEPCGGHGRCCHGLRCSTEPRHVFGGPAPHPICWRPCPATPRWEGLASANPWVCTGSSYGSTCSATCGAGGTRRSAVCSAQGSWVVDGVVNPTTCPACPVSGVATFAFTGGPQAFTVPACLQAGATIFIQAWGAQGGAAAQDFGGGGAGGLGSYAEGRLAVSPGAVLNVFVGGQGATTGAGGFNGGGDGGASDAGGSGGSGGGGGGASDVRVGGVAEANRVITAGGGGGGGRGGCVDSGSNVTPGGGGAGGAGGGGAGTTGGDTSQLPTVAGIATGGQGGNFGNVQGAGGPGGTGCSASEGRPGFTTSTGIGAAGGAARTCCCAGTGAPGAVGAGGGGGGGQVGGGGGGSGSNGVTVNQLPITCAGTNKSGGGGGGGGSSFTGGVLSGATTAGTWSGNGKVTITWG